MLSARCECPVQFQSCVWPPKPKIIKNLTKCETAKHPFTLWLTRPLSESAYVSQPTFGSVNLHLGIFNKGCFA